MKKIELLSMLYNYELEELGDNYELGNIKNRKEHLSELNELMTEDVLLSEVPELLARRSRKRTMSIGKGYLLSLLKDYELEILARATGMDIPDEINEDNISSVIEQMEDSLTVPKLKKEFEILVEKRSEKGETIPESLTNIIAAISYPVAKFQGKSSRSLRTTIRKSVPKSLNIKNVEYPRKVDGKLIRYGNYINILSGFGDHSKSGFVEKLMGEALLRVRDTKFVVIALKEKTGRVIFSAVDRGYLRKYRIFIVEG